MKVKAVIFDMDGLMFDTERLGFEVFKELREEFGITATDEEYLATLGTNASSDPELYGRLFGSCPDTAAFERAFEQRLLKLIERDGIPVKTGLYPLLGYLRENGIKTALATSSKQEQAAAYLKAAKVEGLFDVRVCGDQVSRSKPDPEIFLKAAAGLQEKAEDCLILEDSANGIKAADAAGIRVVWIPDMVTHPDEITDLTFSIQPDLLAVIGLLRM